jgi:hypothetical protein
MNATVKAFIGLCTLFVVATPAQVPSTIHYQGRLMAGTNLVNGNIGMVPRLYTTPTGGTCLYGETQIIHVVDGLYALEIGASNQPARLMQALTNQPLYLEMDVMGTVLYPRERLGAAPYAQIAAQTETNAIATDMLQDQAVTTAKLASNAVTSAQVADGTLADRDISPGAEIQGTKISNVLLLDGSRTMTGMLTISNTLRALSFVGDGAALTNLNGNAIIPATVTHTQIANQAIGSNTLIHHTINLQQINADFVNRAYRPLTNPLASSYSQFGHALAKGPRWLFTGTPMEDATVNNAGIVYVYSLTNTEPSQIITNPTPQDTDYFGYSVAAFSNHCVLVGCPLADQVFDNEGEAFLFDASGVLQATYTNLDPELGDEFGFAVSEFDDNEVAISAPYHNGTGVPVNVGVVYLLEADGDKHKTIDNPQPGDNDLFGYTLDNPVGGVLLVSAPGTPEGGRVYIYRTASAPDLVVTNPSRDSGDQFGVGLAGFDDGRLLVGAPGDNTGGSDAGCAYLFNATGTCLQIYTNPCPAASDEFGHAVTVMAGDRLAISAWQSDTPTNNTGITYVYDCYGTLLMCITNPAPETSDQFGAALAGIARNQLAIGEPGDNTGADQAGSIHLCTIAPKLNDLVAELPEGYALQEILKDDGPGSGLDADRLDGLHAESFIQVREQGYLAAGSTTNIVIPHYRFFTLQLACGIAAQYGMADVSGFENDRWVTVTYTLYNGDGTSDYGGNAAWENSTNNLVTFGRSSNFFYVNMPNEASGDHNLELSAQGSYELLYRLLY